MASYMQNVLSYNCLVNTSYHHIPAPEENRNVAGRNFCASFALSRKISFFCKFWIGPQFLRKFATLQSAIFRKFCNVHEDIYVFPLKIAFSVLGWRANQLTFAQIGLCTVTSAKFT